jgi:sulfatase maturation enzyme AslB (radical SAM superfamily)
MRKTALSLAGALRPGPALPSAQLQTASAFLECAAVDVAVQFSRDHRPLPCRAHCQQWPLLTVQFNREVQRLRFVPTPTSQPAFLHLPGYHLVRLGAPPQTEPAQDRLLLQFLRQLFRHPGWRQAFATLGVSRQDPSGTAVERLVLTRSCNQRCRFCGEQGGEDLSYAEAEGILRDIKRRHPKDIASVLLVITGGEPTLSADLPRIVRRASQAGIGRVLLTTNGSRLAEPGYAASLREAGLSHVEFAFHSHVAQAFDRITGTKGNLPKAVAGLRQALRHFEVSVNTVINRHNYSHLPELVRTLHRLRRQTRGRLRLMPSIVVMEMDSVRGGSWDGIAVAYSKMAPFLAKAIRWDHAQRQRIIMEHFDGRCYAPICIGRRSAEFLEHAPVFRVAEDIPYLADGRGAKGPVGSRVKALGCRRCRYDPSCLGVTPVYAARYGLGELCALP